MTARPAAWRVPGRIEVLGKHTDYAGGHVLVCAVEQAITAVARPARSARPVRSARPGHDGLVARSASLPGEVVLPADSGAGLPPGHWGHYVATAWRRLGANFGALPAADLTITSDLPLASGMSSSSALLVASALALADLAGLRDTPRWRAHLGEDRLAWAAYLASIENGSDFGPLAGDAGVGTRGGSEDHTGMLCSRTGQLGQFGFDPLARIRHVAVPAGWTFVVAVSGVTAEKTGAALADYNRASAATAQALSRWNTHTGRRDASLAAAVRTTPDAAARLAGLLADAPALRDRLEQFVTESEVLVPAAAGALADGDLAAFGGAVADSQRLAETALGNQVPETIHLAADAHALGAAASSAFGAGFGGSVWALVREPDAEGFADAWLGRHLCVFPERAERASTLVTAASAPAHPLDVA